MNEKIVPHSYRNVSLWIIFTGEKSKILKVSRYRNSVEDWVSWNLRGTGKESPVSHHWSEGHLLLTIVPIVSVFHGEQFIPFHRELHCLEPLWIFTTLVTLVRGREESTLHDFSSCFQRLYFFNKGTQRHSLGLEMLGRPLNWKEHETAMFFETYGCKSPNLSVIFARDV